MGSTGLTLADLPNIFIMIGALVALFVMLVILLSKSDYCRRFICNTVNIGYNNYVSKPNRLNFNSSESNSFTPTSRKTTRYRKIWRH
ncbi:hypothetical protein B5X24_HaOG211984 [Helicoverpa armigera]|uniref:Uncharacterized protein n=1 Tax=Helicoverpa armigera TaxID=29058 RepID=A0A2W1B8F9_HELAM|nr:hypothetical protein B5X24_HaOG211984 [Helicoverpa armigera]